MKRYLTFMYIYVYSALALLKFLIAQIIMQPQIICLRLNNESNHQHYTVAKIIFIS